MRRRAELHQPALARRHERFHVALKRRLERLRGRPFRMLWRQNLHAIEDEGQLSVHRVFDPQGAIVVERRDALGRRHEIRPALLGDAGHEAGDCLFARAVVPRRQRAIRRRRLRQRRPGQKRPGNCRKHCQSREQRPTADPKEGRFL